MFGTKNPIAAAMLSAAIICIALCGAAPDATADSVTFITAIPVAVDELTIRGQAEVDRASGDPTPQDQRLWTFDFSPAFAYGLTRRIALFVQPTVSANVLGQNTTTQGRVTRDSGGVGDTLFFGRYTLLQKDLVAATFRIAPLVGMYFPTGSATLKDSVGVLPDYLQTGAGSWDPYVGNAITYESVNLEFDLSGTYRFNTGGSRFFRLGDIAEIDTSFQYRLWPWPLPPIIPKFLVAVVESNLVWQQPGQIGYGANASYTGGLTWIIDPGVRYITEFLDTGVVFRIPVAQYLHGAQLTQDLGLFVYLEHYFTLPSLFPN